MRAREFAEGYPREISRQALDTHAYAQHIGSALDWSQVHGSVLHQSLRGETVDFTSAKIGEYANWMEQEYPVTRARVDEMTSLEDRRRAMNTLNFHTLNSCMLGLWEPVKHGGWATPQERQMALRVAEDGLAIAGFDLYWRRQKFVEKEGTPALFAPEVRALHKGMTGIIHEIDTALILVDIIRRKRNWTVVPAPLQFESSKNGGRNVDFVVVDFAEDKAVGVQAKTMITPGTYNKADHKRVVFVDGDVDFNSIRMVRTQKGRSKETVVPWPGVLAARRFNGIKAHRSPIWQALMKANRTTEPDRRLIQWKMESNNLVGSMRIDYSKMSSLIENRISEKI